MDRCLNNSRVDSVLLTEERRLAADLVVCTELGLDPLEAIALCCCFSWRVDLLPTVEPRCVALIFPVAAPFEWPLIC